jgi:flavin-dependent dehydrogenase
LILGAGPAGCATALGLLAAGVGRVLLVDKPIAQPFRIGESATPDVAGLLAELGLEGLEHQGHLPYQGNLSAWGDDAPRLDHFLSRGRGCGWHLDRAAFDAWMRDVALARGGRLANPSGIDAIAAEGEGWRVSVRGLGETSARVLVDAGGRRSPLATRLGAHRRTLDGLQALAAHTDGCVDMGGLSLVESFADGWWYATALPDGRVLVTLMTDRDIAKARGFADPAVFSQAWKDTGLLSRHVPAPASLAHVQAFAAHGGCIDRAAGRSWICVGDALMAFDPLSSSGISGALHDALAAVPAILGQLDGRIDPARDYALRADCTFRRYLAERRQRYAAERRWPEHAFWARRAGQG